MLDVVRKCAIKYNDIYEVLSANLSAFSHNGMTHLGADSPINHIERHH